MRTREENRDYIRFYRFRKKFDRYKNAGEGICHYCGEQAETLHHINERHDDNRKENLLPLCNKCHLEITHLCDKPHFYQTSENLPPPPKKRPFKAQTSPFPRVTSPKDTTELYSNCNTQRICNVTLLNTNTCIKINIVEVSIKTVELLNSWGFTKVINV